MLFINIYLKKIIINVMFMLYYEKASSVRCSYVLYLLATASLIQLLYPRQQQPPAFSRWCAPRPDGHLDTSTAQATSQHRCPGSQHLQKHPSQETIKHFHAFLKQEGPEGHGTLTRDRNIFRVPFFIALCRRHLGGLNLKAIVLKCKSNVC